MIIIFLIFLFLGFVFAAIWGLMQNKNKDLVKLFSGVYMICNFIAIISFIIFIAPDIFSDLVSIMYKIIGWCGSILAGIFLFVLLFGFTKRVGVLVQQLTMSQEQCEKQREQEDNDKWYQEVIMSHVKHKTIKFTGTGLVKRNENYESKNKEDDEIEDTASVPND